MRKDCEARLRDLVHPDEAIVAVGTTEELRTLGPEIGSGGGWTFVVVTVHRVLFASWGSPEKPHEEVRLDDVSHWAHGSQYNCYALALTHPPLTRRERVPAHRILWIRWGEADADVTRTRTIFRFSRPETEVAKALRAALEARGIPEELLTFREGSRSERTRGSQTVLHSRRPTP